MVSNSYSGKEIKIIAIIGLIAIILKLIGVLNLSWMIILAPFWLGIGSILLILLIIKILWK